MGIKYNPALDGIRGVAVLAVIAVHSCMPIAKLGFAGVDVFFVLSGFLITSILKDGVDLRTFYIRRLRRLYPALLAMLLFYLAIVPWIFPGNYLREALAAAVYISDYTIANDIWHQSGAFGHTWSLAVEEQFYLVWPFVVLGLSRIKTPRVVIYILVLAFILETAYRIWAHVELGMLVTYYRFDTRLEGLILGALLAYLPSLPHRAWGLAIIPLLWAAQWTLDHSSRAFPTLFMELAAAATILWAMSGSARPLAWPPLVYIGRISYGLYLYHGPAAWLIRKMEAPWPIQLAFTLLAAVPLAYYSHKYIEARWLKRQATTASILVRREAVSAL